MTAATCSSANIPEGVPSSASHCYHIAYPTSQSSIFAQRQRYRNRPASRDAGSSNFDGPQNPFSDYQRDEMLSASEEEPSEAESPPLQSNAAGDASIALRERRRRLSRRLSLARSLRSSASSMASTSSTGSQHNRLKGLGWQELDSDDVQSMSSVSFRSVEDSDMDDRYVLPRLGVDIHTYLYLKRKYIIERAEQERKEKKEMEKKEMEKKEEDERERKRKREEKEEKRKHKGLWVRVKRGWMSYWKAKSAK